MRIDGLNAYFLGAGVSAPLDIPTFRPFMQKAEETCNKLQDEEIKRTFETVLKLWKDRFDDNNIEEYYSYVEMLGMVYFPFRTVTTKDIEDVIYYTIKESAKKIKNKSYLRELLEDVNDKKGKIITTNWDIELDLECYKEWKGIEDYRDYLYPEIKSLENFSPFVKGYIPEFQGKAKLYTGNKVYYTDKDDKNVLEEIPPYRIWKLHGSLNWGYCKKCGIIYHSIEIYNNIVDCKCKSCGNKLERFIVPPTLAKLSPEKIGMEENGRIIKGGSPYFMLREIWSGAHNILSQCEYIYFIGYSFPETDIFLRIFVTSSLRFNRNLKNIVVISNPKSHTERFEFEDRYMSVISMIKESKPNVKFYYDGVENYKKIKKNYV